jgi:hypothetical protein
MEPARPDAQVTTRQDQGRHITMEIRTMIIHSTNSQTVIPTVLTVGNMARLGASKTLKNKFIVSTMS